MKRGRQGDESILATPASSPSVPLQSPSVPSKRRLIGLCVALLLIAVFAWYSRGQQIREWWLQRQSTESLKAAAQNPDADPQLLYIYGKRLLTSGEGEAAQEAFGKAASRLNASDHSPLAQHICSYAGYLYARSGDSKQAVPLLTRAREQDSDDPLPYMGFGILLADQKMGKFAVTQFQVATQLDPMNAEGWYRLGTSLVDDLKASEAIEPLKQAVKFAPGDASSHAELGVAYAIQSQFPFAVIEFRKASELAPENEDYRAALANALAMNAHSQSEYQTASASLEQLLQSRSHDEMLEFTLGLLHLRFNNIEQARVRFQHSVTAKPTNAEAWYNLYVSEQRLGHDAAAEAARKHFQQLSDARTETVNLEKKVGAQSSDPALRLALSDAYERTGNLLGAYWQVNTATRLGLSNPEVLARMERLKRKLSTDKLTPGTSMLSGTGGQVPGPPPPPQLVSLPVSGGKTPTKGH